VALPDLAAGLGRHRAGETGNRGPVASQKLPALLAVAITPSGRPKTNTEIHDLIRQMSLANPL
jgi:hypothetical protein